MTRTPPRGTKAEAIRAYLRKHPEATRNDFVKATKIEVLHSHFSTVRFSMQDELAELNKHTKSWKEVAANVDPRKPAPPQPIINVQGDLDGAAGDMYVDLHEANNIVLQLRDTEKKMDEYRYRCWKLEGEKFGYTQRLLDESKK